MALRMRLRYYLLLQSDILSSCRQLQKFGASSLRDDQQPVASQEMGQRASASSQSLMACTELCFFCDNAS